MENLFIILIAILAGVIAFILQRCGYTISVLIIAGGLVIDVMILLIKDNSHE